MAFYAVDGIDGSGKSSAAGFIADILREQGRKVTVVEHPDRSRWSGRVCARLLLKDSPGSRFMTGVFFNINLFSTVLRKRSIMKGCDDLVVVRYTLSSAYISESLAHAAYKALSAVLPEPDVRIYIDIDPDVAMKRIAARGGELESFETSERLKEVRDRMLSLADDWSKVDNSGSREESEEGLRKVVDSYLATAAD
ncbi:MAG: dTMP kinase [Methanomethylophilus sp.]|jgi:dTMP kinase